MNPLTLALFTAIVHTLGVPKSVTLPTTAPVYVRADAAWTMARTAVDAEFPKATPEEKAAWVVRAWGWSGPESAWTVGAMGDCDDPAHRTVTTCRSFGIVQTSNPEAWGWTRKEVLADGVAGYRVWLRMAQDSIAKCGSVAAGLGVLASGKCGGAPVKVLGRCRMLGDSC